MSINIQDIVHTPTDRLSPLPGDQFFEALRAEFKGNNVEKAVTWVFNQPDSAYSGTKAFKERVLSSFDGMIAPADQKYLADITQRIVLGQLK